jgi:hypothetical protein
MTRGRVLIPAALALFAAALSIDAAWPRVNRWFDSHALTTDLISSAFFALLVSFVISRISRQREAERLKVPAREALQRVVFAGQQATSSLRQLIEGRAAELEVDGSGVPEPAQLGDPLEILQTPRARELAQCLYQISSVEPAWLATTLAANAERLADLASERIVAAGSILALAADPEATEWALEDANTLRSIASAARTIASYYAPLEEVPVSPLMTALAEAARRDLPNLLDDIAAVVRDGIAAEDLGAELRTDIARDRRKAADNGVKSIALMLAMRENLSPSLKKIFAL